MSRRQAGPPRALSAEERTALLRLSRSRRAPAAQLARARRCWRSPKGKATRRPRSLRAATPAIPLRAGWRGSTAKGWRRWWRTMGGPSAPLRRDQAAADPGRGCPLSGPGAQPCRDRHLVRADRVPGTNSPRPSHGTASVGIVDVVTAATDTHSAAPPPVASLRYAVVKDIPRNGTFRGKWPTSSSPRFWCEGYFFTASFAGMM